jgi:hypothetical protein
MMKTKKILAILISCLLLIGAVVGLTASAADAPTVEIVAANVSYDGATRILYTVDNSSLAAGQKVQIAFSYDENCAAPTGTLNPADFDFVSSSFGTVTVGGKAYKAVYSDGFEPAEINKKVYAFPVITDAQGNIVAGGARVGFSVYDYLMTRLGSGNYTDEQYLLYLATLDFSGSVQNAEKITEGKEPAYGYSDAYYGLRIVNGDGSVTLKNFREPTDYQIVAPKSSGGKLFDHFENENGEIIADADFNKLTVSVNKIGYATVKAVYGDIDVVSATIPAGNSATIPNPDSVTVNSGSEFFIEGDVILSEGASATLQFNPDVLSVALTEGAGKVTVSDGVSSFEMANGATLRVEYTVLSTKNLTGVVFYYVNGEYVTKSDLASTQNSSFSGVSATTNAGVATFDAVSVGATSSIMTVGNTLANTTATFEYDENGKYVVVSKAAENTDYGSVYFTYGGTRLQHAVFETEMKLTGALYNSGWRNYFVINLQTLAGSSNLINPQIMIQKNSFYVKGTGITPTTTALDTPIADDGWFTLKIDVVSALSADGVTTPGVLTIYINDQIVYQEALNSTNKLGNVQFEPSDDAGESSIAFRNDKFYTVED